LVSQIHGQQNVEEILGLKRRKLTWPKKNLHIEEIYDFYCSLNIVWVIEKKEMGGASGTQGSERKCVHAFGGEV
jgi:hypothetical protein